MEIKQDAYRNHHLGLMEIHHRDILYADEHMNNLHN